MLRSIKDLTTYPIEALDGTIGKAKDALFDDRFWTLRYLVTDTGKWLPGRKVLLSPQHLGKPEIGYSPHRFPVDLTKKQIEDSPKLEEDAPVSRQFETEFAKYYKYDLYWVSPGLSVNLGIPDGAASATSGKSPEEQIRHAHKVQEIQSSHLRSAKEVMGYNINALDEEFGHVEDFIMEDDTWVLKYLVVDSRNWLPGKKFLIDLDWIRNIDWSERLASTRLTREQIESAPEFDPHEPINQDYLKNLYDYYGVPHTVVDPSAVGTR
jgi:hypothetical protein